MFSSELNMIIAQNCGGYKAKYLYSPMSLGTSSESCNNCSNYYRGKCLKGFKNDLAEKIKFN